MPRLDNAISESQQHLDPLASRGWSLHRLAATDPNSIVRELGRIGDLLGTRAAGRAGSLEEVIQPRATAVAHPRSLSARYGLDNLPFHAELSHRTKPCRYLLLGCLDPGFCAAATMLLDWRKLEFSKKEFDLLKATPVLVRTGRRSFYSTILAPGGDFLRYDLGCIEALDARGVNALKLVEERIATAEVETHHWSQGDILIIDNWCILHGRSPSDKGSGRRLARVLINA